MARRVSPLSILTVLFLINLLNLSLPGCASDAKRRSEQDMIVVEKKSDHQIVAEFNGACATALAEGKIHLGDQHYVIQHDGKTYYFASEEAKQKFQQNLDDNLQRANHNWENSVVGSRQPT
jgi:YHS domain-containing protein